MSTGIRLTDKESSPTINALVGIRTSPTEKVTSIAFGDLEQQLLGGAVGNAIDVAAAGYVFAATWAVLATINGTRAGQPGRVGTTDAGTHTDPVVGGTVPNAGEFAWSASPAGWRRVGATPNLDIIQATTGVPDAAKPIGTNAAGIMDISFLPANFRIMQDEGLLNSGGDGLRALIGVSDDGTGTQVGPWAARINDLANRPDTLPKVYLAGDSRPDQCSSDYSTEARGFLWWLQFLSGASFDFQLGQNYGVAGSETSELVGQAVSIAGQEPGIAICFTGTNDRPAGYLADHTIMNYEAAEAVLTKAGGHRVIWATDTPRGDGNGKGQSAALTGDNLGNHLRCAQWLRESAKRKGVYSADLYPALINPADASAKGRNDVYYDGLHPGLLGGYLIALQFLPIIDHLVPRRSRLPFSNADTYTAANSSGSLIDNPMMAGISGTVGANCTGQVANLFTAVAGAGLTAALSKVTDAAGVVWQQIALTGTPSGTHTNGPPLNADPVSCVLSIDLDVADFATGDVIEAVCAAEIDTGHSGLRGIPLYLVATAGGVDTLVCGGEPNMASEGASVTAANLRVPDPGTKLAGVNITPQLTIPASLTAVKLKVLVTAKGGDAVNATVRFSRIAARKVIYNG